ncbi:glucosaminidase domain-containing protein [Paenibacillus guangzhouensis]|uniref:glucosaminidase domain-containing protein n=1 Tax=Paenibacillus guangzhouensis TaxID=1473112 RepID=UPI00187BB015|nr:glucosaminidase domain-containing protein [Paenibacillus guangzhouensis]
MRKLLNHSLFVYVLCLTLLLTVGMDFLTSTQAAGTHLNVPNPRPVSSPVIDEASILGPVFPVHLSSAQSLAKESSRVTTLSISKPSPQKIATVAKPSFDRYQVTASYLNVRANPYATSKKMDMKKKGTVLQVVRKMPNGWLQLKDGGYVHGGYTEQMPQIDPDRLFPDVVKMTKRPARTIPKPVATEPAKPTSSIQSDSGLSEEHIAQLFKGTALAGHELEEAVLEIEEQYGINAYFTIAVMKLESGNGKSKLAKTKNNLFGLNATGGSNKNAFNFKSKGASVEKFGQLLSKNYVKKGYTTIEKVATKYCPVNPKWPSLVKGIMKSDYKKL